MTLKDQKAILNAIFKVGIDGGSSNIYYILDKYMDRLPVADKLSFTLPALKSVLSELSKEWDKEIDKFV